MRSVASRREPAPNAPAARAIATRAAGVVELVVANVGEARSSTSPRRAPGEHADERVEVARGRHVIVDGGREIRELAQHQRIAPGSDDWRSRAWRARRRACRRISARAAASRSESAVVGAGVRAAAVSSLRRPADAAAGSPRNCASAPASTAAAAGVLRRHPRERRAAASADARSSNRQRELTHGFERGGIELADDLDERGDRELAIAHDARLIGGEIAHELARRAARNLPAADASAPVVRSCCVA